MALLFEKYSPIEFRDLWSQSKREILADIQKRNGVQRRKSKDWPLIDVDREYEVRVVPRSVSSGGSSSNWFYLRIKGYSPFTTGVRMDIDRPSELFLKNNPTMWWKKSQQAEFLRMEIRAAKAFVVIFPVKLIKEKDVTQERPFDYLSAALEDWGFDSKLLEVIDHDEIGRTHLEVLCNEHHSIRVDLQKRYYAQRSEKRALEDQKVRPYIQKLKIRMKNGIEWIPGKPILWNEKTETGFLRYENGKIRFFCWMDQDLEQIIDANVLLARFEHRYPHAAKQFAIIHVNRMCKDVEGDEEE